jgi:signal transduction histidine kinase
LTAFAAIEQLNIDKRTVLYRVANEALNNVSRHAQASLAEVSIEKLPESISMKIKDNGKSFDVESVLHANRGRRLGLLGMRERLEMVGGNFLVESEPGKGTVVWAQFPVGKARSLRRRKTC